MIENQPTVIIIAGANGSGKSTAAERLLRGAFFVEDFVNADTIAGGLSAYQPEKAAIQAGRIMLKRLEELGGQHSDFAFETTLASRSFAHLIGELKKSGYRFILLFFWLNSPELAIRRVEKRVLAGGHHVPDDDVRRRYVRGLQNFFELYMPLANEWFLYDNSDEKRLMVARGLEGVTEILQENLWGEIHRSAQKVEEPARTYQTCTERSPQMRHPTVEEITEALNLANRIAFWEHKMLGHPIVVSRNGKIITIQPEDIDINEDPRKVLKNATF